MYDDGKTMSEIAENFNSKGLRNTRGTKFNINAISKILRNRRYIGEYKYRDITIPDGIPAIVPDGIPAIVPKDLFERIQKQMQKNKKAPARYKAEADYILTTKLYCGKCVGESGTSRNSTTYRYYKCIDAKRNKGCDKKAVKKDRIEDLVINQIIRVLWDDELIDSLADMVIDLQSKENTTLPLLKKQLSETEKSINNMLDAIQQGIITSSTKKRLEDLENQKKEIEINIAQESIKNKCLLKSKWYSGLSDFVKLILPILSIAKD